MIYFKKILKRYIIDKKIISKERFGERNIFFLSLKSFEFL